MVDARRSYALRRPDEERGFGTPQIPAHRSKNISAPENGLRPENGREHRPAGPRPGQSSGAATRQSRPFAFMLRRVDTGARARRACHKRGIDDRGIGFFQFQPVILDLAADLGQQIIMNPALDQCIAKAAMHSSGTGACRSSPQNSMKSSRTFRARSRFGSDSPCHWPISRHLNSTIRT